MSDRSPTPVGHLRAITTLMLTVLPFGLIITLINAVGFVQTRAILPKAPISPISFNAYMVGPALRRFDEFGLRRTLWVAVFFVVAAVVFVALGLLLRRGARRFPAGALLVAGILITAYLICLWWMYVHDPITDFEGQRLPAAGGRIEVVPWDMKAVAPDWYRPTLALTLIAAGAAQAAAGFLLARPASVAWISRRAAGGDGFGIAARGTRRGGIVLLILTPGLAVLYAVVNAIAITVASHPLETDFGPTAVGNWVVIYIVALLSLLPWAFGGLRLARGRVSPAVLMWLGALTVFHALILLLLSVWRADSIYGTVFADAEARIMAPGWYPPFNRVFVAVAGLWLIANLATLARARLPAPDTEAT